MEQIANIFSIFYIFYVSTFNRNNAHLSAQRCLFPALPHNQAEKTLPTRRVPHAPHSGILPLHRAANFLTHPCTIEQGKDLLLYSPRAPCAALRLSSSARNRT